MKWFENIRLRQKLLIGFGLIMFSMLIIVGTAYQGLQNIKETQLHTATHEVPVITKLTQLNMLLNVQRADMLEAMLHSNSVEREKLSNAIVNVQKQVNTLMDELIEIEKSDKGTLHELDKIKTISEDSIKTRLLIFQLLNNGKTQEALALMLGIQNERIDHSRLINQRLIEKSNNQIITAIQHSEIIFERTTYVFLILVALSVSAIFALIVIFNRVIAKPLNELTAVADKISKGNLNIHLEETHRKDEVGILATEFIRMSNILKGYSQSAKQIAAGDLTLKVVPLSSNDLFGHSFKTMVESLRYFSSQVLEGIQILTTSVSQISTSTSELASSSTQTATAVSETTSTIEEVRQTSEITNQKAKLVSDTAQAVVKISETGKSATDETNKGMKHIREQMEFIAQSMIRVSEQTQTISTIIAVVDDLAQQSNLLAVNASIEAEKAGEQGKGFRIVAQEIKSLADQSKQATHRIRDILTDVQKATNSAVLATERGTKVVEEGSKIANETGDAISKLAIRVNESADAAIQIATSSHQQLIGMEQATIAMENIKQASTQNVESAKQLETATHNLQELGFKLHQLVTQYKLENVSKYKRKLSA